MVKAKIPNEIIKFKSSDKEHHQKPDLDDLANCCSPVFCVIAGNVNCGKTSMLKNYWFIKTLFMKELLYIVH